MENVQRIIVFVLTITGLLLGPAIVGESNLSSTTALPPTGPASDIERSVNVPTPTTSSVTTTSLSNDPNSTDWTIESPPWNLKDRYLDGQGQTSPSPRITSTAAFSSNRTVELDFRTVTLGSKSYYAARIAGKYVDFYDKVTLTVLSGAALGMTVFSGASVNNYPSTTILDPTNWYRAKMVFLGNQVTLYLNGTLYLRFTDPIVGQLAASSVSLEAFGNSEAEFNNMTITGSVLPDEPPAASFSFSPDLASPGQTVFFDGTLSSDPDGYITNFSWGFGDGSTGTGAYPSHIYTAPGNYTVTLTVTDTSGQTATRVQKVEITSPVIASSPSNGPVGTKVFVHGSNFPVLTGPYATATTIDVTFDDQLVGFTTTTDGSFNFVFNIPVAQPGLHQIHATGEIYPTTSNATTNFIVTSQPTRGSTLTITVAALYFPGDTATIYVLSSLNGNPAAAQRVSLTLLLPNGTSRNLALSPVKTGLYRATYAIQTTSTIGTYALFATSTVSNVNATALGNFEVKLTWLQANGHMVLIGSSILGVIGTVSFLGVAWRKGYLKMTKADFSDA